MQLNSAEQAIVAIGAVLQDQGYSFTAVTPGSHRRVLNRPATVDEYREAFGWSRPFHKSKLPEQIIHLLRSGDLIAETIDTYRSRVRFSSLDGLLFCHSSFPTTAEDAVFFGPDSYRFAATIRRHIQFTGRESISTVVDVGCGAGPGGIYLAERLGLPSSCRIYLSDISEKALSMSRSNIAINGVTGVEVQRSDLLDAFANDIDLIISNPPYLADPQKRLYRDGGGEFGTGLSLRIVEQAIEHLKPDGTLILYTGTPVIEGVDLFKAGLDRLASPRISTSYEELDPDVFGEELDFPPYDGADRIAVVSLILRKT